MGDIITNPPTTPNTVSDSWQPLVERDTMGYFGKNKITLTNWDASTTAPAIAQGSTIDIDGSIARFTADEAIGGAPADGTVYLMFVVTGLTVTAEWTAEFPTWTANKGGWYTAAGNRCSGHNASKVGTVYTNKSRFSDENQGDSVQTLGGGGAYIDDLYTGGGNINIDSLAVDSISFPDDSIWTGTYSTQTLPSLGNSMLAGGAYMISTNNSNGRTEYLQGGVWRRNGIGSTDVDFAISNGSNCRLYNADSSDTTTFYITKIW